MSIGFSQTLSELNHSFSLIGLTETRFNVSKEVVSNFSLFGYEFISQPSLSNAGGTEFFINEKLCYHIRADLSLSTNECLWIEISSNLNHNIVCGVIIIHRHPHIDIDVFMNSLSHSIDKINNENKYCIMMGDFNLNLLNSDSHPATDEFLNNLGSYFFNHTYSNLLESPTTQLLLLITSFLFL